MKLTLPVLLERTLLLVLVITVTLPLFAGAYLRFSHNQSPGTAWLRNTTLYGTPYQARNVALTRSSLLSSKYQTALANDYDHSFPAREAVIRFINEIYFRLFEVSNGVVVGRHSTLFERLYIEEYCLEREDENYFLPQAADLRRMQDFCEARGIAFSVLITPSKPAIYPEELPASWQRRFRLGVRRYDRILPLLRKNGIHYVDGHRILTDMKPNAELPLYPLGGIHWGDQAALATSNELLTVLGRQGLPVKPITRFESDVTHYPRDGRDRDLGDFLNLITRFDYPVLEIAPVPEPPTVRYRPNIVFVGGSFDYKVLTLFDETRQFSELAFFDYYTLSKYCEVDEKIYQLAVPTHPVNFEREVFAADALVLEVNEQALYIPNHLSRFLHDALAVLPDPHAARAPYLYEGQDAYQWGGTLSFIAGKNPVRFISGFTDPGGVGAYTDGPRATLRIAASPAPEDMVLQVTGDPFLWGTRLATQEADVYIDNHPLGKMIWRRPGSSTCELSVPKELLGAGRMQLELRFAHSLSSRDLGISADPRKLGVCVSGIRIAPLGEASPGTIGMYHWGDSISFRKDGAPVAPVEITGISEPDTAGAFTLGPLATMRFTTAPAAQDMVLSVEAGAFLVDTRLPVQTAQVFVNGHSVGQWEWKQSAVQLHELTVPKDFLGGGETQVEFRLEHATSPAKLGLGNDPREFGILMSKVRLHEPNK